MLGTVRSVVVVVMDVHGALCSCVRVLFQRRSPTRLNTEGAVKTALGRRFDSCSYHNCPPSKKLPKRTHVGIPRL